jgi:hypothetical protein
MKALILTLAIGALAVGGYIWFRQMQPGAPDTALFAPPPPPSPPPAAEHCTARDAVYEYNDDRRLMLRFRQLPATQEIEVASINGQQIGNMAFVVHITSFGDEYVFLPVNSGPASGPQYETAVVRVRPESGGAPFEVAMFDSQMRYIAHLPRDHTAAPAYIYMTGMLPQLYRGRVDQPPGMFRFQACETPPASTQP